VFHSFLFFQSTCFILIDLLNSYIRSPRFHRERVYGTCALNKLDCMYFPPFPCDGCHVYDNQLQEIETDTYMDDV